VRLLSTIRRIYSLKLPIIIVGFLLPLSLKLKAQVIEASYLHEPWKASWISVPGANPTGYGVYYFRKGFELTSVPKAFPVYVSADNRYKLFVNQKLVSIGPARGDLAHWNYETVDLTPFLKVGQNIIAAQVWNEAELRTEGHVSLRTAFILQGAAAESQVLNSGKSWRCMQDNSYSPIPVLMQTYYVAGPGERMNMAAHPKDWEKISFEDND